MVTLQAIVKPALVKTVTICREKGLKMSMQEGTEQLNREYILPYCRLQLYDAYTVVMVNEGVHIDFAEIEEISTVLQNHYQDKQIVAYIIIPKHRVIVVFCNILVLVHLDQSIDQFCPCLFSF